MTLSIETSKGTRDFDGPGPIRIGRDPSAELVVDNPNVSRFHAELRQEDGAWRLIDTNSTQGVFVGGQKVENVALDGRTEVVLGRTDEAERITVTASEPSSNDAATQLPAPPPAGTILPDDAPQRPGGGLRDAEVGAAAGTVVTDQSINVQCAGQSFTFQPGQKAVFGREADCQVTTDNPTVSRHHAELRFDGTYWHLVDLDSSRGTYVDGERITDTYVYGSQAAWLGDPEAGERIVFVTAGERPPKVAAPERSGSSSGGKVLALIGALVLVAIIVAGVVLIVGGGSSGPSRNELAQATVELDAGSYTGSGVVIDAKKGLILTNAHVGNDHAPGLALTSSLSEIAGFNSSPKELTVLVSSGNDRAAEPKYKAEAVAWDGYLDVAVLKITKTAAGALISPKDLEGLKVVKLGDSAKVHSGDKVRVLGYPASSASRNPTLTEGNIASDTQDNRLNTNRAWFNSTAGTSGGNSGGAVVDSDGKLIGISTLHIAGGNAAAPNISRPVNLLKPVITAAEKGADYSSPYIFPLPDGAKVVATAVATPSGDVGFSTGCDSTASDVSVGARGVAVQVQYAGFTPNQHQDIAIFVTDPNGEVIGQAATNDQYPFKFEDKNGCVTANIPLESRIASGEKYDANVLIGPKLDQGRVNTFSVGSNDTNTNNNNHNNNPTPPPSA